MTLTDKNKLERVYLGFDFTLRLDTGETISDATFFNRSLDGSDSGASAMLSGNAIISSGIVKNLVINGVAGSIYELSVVVNTSGGRRLFTKTQYKVN
jgi:hypothetical protein